MTFHKQVWRESGILSLLALSLAVLAAGCASDSPSRFHSQIKMDRTKDESQSLAATAAAVENSGTTIQGQGAVVGGVGANGTAGAVAVGGGAANSVSGVGVNAIPGSATVVTGSGTGPTTSSGASIGAGLSGTGTGSGSSTGGTGATGASIRSSTPATGNTTSLSSTPTTPTIGGTPVSPLGTTPTALSGSGIGSSVNLSPRLTNTPSASSLLLPQTNLLSTNIFGKP